MNGEPICEDCKVTLVTEEPDGGGGLICPQCTARYSYDEDAFTAEDEAHNDYEQEHYS